MNMAKIYDTRSHVLRTWLHVKRLLAEQIAADPQISQTLRVWLRRSFLRRYFAQGRHRQRHDVKQYRHVPGTTEKISYYLEPTIRQRIKAARKNRVMAPVARGWHAPTDAFPTLQVDDTFVGFLVQRGVVPVVQPSADEATQRRAIHEALTARNNATLILTGAEGPLAP